VIGFWPRVAIDLYEASTNALATELAQVGAQSLARAGGAG
jgi:NAD(P)H-quinone oxidoreductase subunit 4